MRALDGTLLDWADIANMHNWDTLLLGNGMSINVWEPFGYRVLFDKAKADTLAPEERKLFERTPNFERVLGDLLTAARVNKILGLETEPLLGRYRHIQRALAKAVKAVHVNRERVPLSTRKAVRRELLKHQWVFTTSYDLLLYWSIGCEGFNPFVDHFRFGGRCEFDPDRAKDRGTPIPVYFLHGALHLVTGKDGATWKLTQGNLDSLLNQFGKPIEGDRTARPLLVTEGSAIDKLVAIEENVYLAHALRQLAKRATPVVVFGSSLSEHDAHLAEALSEHPDRPVAVSMLPGPPERLLAQQSDIYGRLKANPLLFFDATTHPLGNPKLRVEGRLRPRRVSAAA
ncbi:MAG TPA: DUF4917 family protein [Solirubrobacterales bacterium]|nr:DUF4917 family protein [Solirubrobacterales bacterium]